VPLSQRYFAPGQLEFITSSVYCRVKLFPGPRPASSPRTTSAELRAAPGGAPAEETLKNIEFCAQVAPGFSIA
jgi:hypothetical protein